MSSRRLPGGAAPAPAMPADQPAAGGVVGSHPQAGAGLSAAVRDQLARLLGGLHYGSIEIQVHDGRVVSIERRERVRLAPPAAPQPGS